MLALVGNDADPVGTALHVLVQALQRIGGMPLGAMGRRKIPAGQPIVLG
jgi:hypothetical protein